MKPKVAVVGAGYWGKNLIRNFDELGHLAAICDGNEMLEAGYRDLYPHIPFVPEYQKVLADSSVDAVVLATPAATHYRMAKQAILAGKHVFVEKPLALNVQEGEELVRLARDHGLILMVGHILHYHGAVRKLKQLVDEGEVGKLQYIYSNRLNIGKIRTEENILWSFAPHDISTILMLVDERPDWVFACGGSYLQEGVADTTITYLNFPSGVKAHIFVSWLHPFKEQKLVVVGDRKMAVFNDTADEKLVLYPHEIKWKNRIPVASRAEGLPVPFDASEPLRNECRHFLDCIVHGLQPKTDGREGLDVLRVLTASQESLDKGGCVVHMSAGPSAKRRTEPPMDGAAVFRNVFIHPSAYVDDHVTIEEGTTIWHFTHVLSGSTIGRDCRIGQNVVIGPRVTIGNGCKIQNNVSVYEGVTLEDYVFCGPSAVFTNVYNPRSEIRRMHELRPTLVRKGASLGANCTIVCGITIGTYAFVGAGAVVTRDVPDYALVLGNPARVVGWMCRCGVKLSFEGHRGACKACGMTYTRGPDGRIAPADEMA
ncbi:Gfo/Idh/MocA family oxidoreductase [Desulfosoma sp.]|uniref:Gfo/Idh/MocA family oxidoreductase n=1 Tax=Desulfosoma sp. TaxID=2603217 RepID=UPI0040496127